MALNDFSPQINAREVKLRELCLNAVVQAGKQSIARGDLQSKISATDAEIKSVIRLLVDEELVTVLGHNLLATEIVNGCRESLLKLFHGTTVVGLPAFREATGLSRNLATLVLEFFDSGGLTRRVAEGRVLARSN